MKGIQIAIDRGGTFCDFIAKFPDRPDYVFKLLSVDLNNYKDAPTEGIRRILERAQDIKIPKDEKLGLELITSIRMGTTVATNALLERKGAKVCLITTKGFKDVLAIGNQTRPHIFDLTAKKLGHLYTDVIEIDERVTIEGFSEGGGDKLKIMDSGEPELTHGVTGDVVRVIKKPDYEKITEQLTELYKGGEIKAIALCLLHSYTYPEHESKIAEICRSIGFRVSVSHKLQPMIGMVNRASSTVADAYLSPIINNYIEGFGSGFKGGLEAFGNKLLFMQSNGGLCPWYKFTGLKAILSGPAGGMVGYGETCYDDLSQKATIGFDAGGTSTDVSRYSGSLEHIYDTVVSEVSLQTPQLDISTVAAGGGSMLFWRNGMFVVGPESAGSDPGPACYRKGGPLTVTDANLFLGRLLPYYFPKIFGPNQDEALDFDLTSKKFKELTEEINKDKESEGIKLTPEEVASGFLKVAVESMARPIRNLTEAKGFVTSEHNLACFGGSGGQFSVSLSKNLGISHVAIHKYSSLLSAYGIYLADIVIEKQSPTSFEYSQENYSILDQKIESLVDQAFEEYHEQGLSPLETSVEVYLNMRYVGSDTHILIQKGKDEYNLDSKFIERHNNEFGFTLDRKVLVDDLQVLFIVKSTNKQKINPYNEFAQMTHTKNEDESKIMNKIYFEGQGWLESSVYHLPDLKVGTTICGPSIILDDTQTILIEPKSQASILSNHILIVVEQEEKPKISNEVVDPIQLSVFGHRFMSIAEQMGRTLQQTAISTNIKERLDFSCALFDRNGDLVANAPHVPIHLGAMSFAVKAQKEMWEGKLQKGDVLVTNHPSAGGSHLPDITVITPVLDKDNNPVFWTASRGHHADIGSISAGSMPPNSKTIFDEGAAIITHKLCSDGKFDEEGITRLLLEEPAKHPGGSGTRTLSDNISDLKAQVAANYKGIILLNRLIEEFSLSVINLYMGAIQSTAEVAVRNLLRLAYEKFHGKAMQAIDYLDDGTPISLQISINPTTGDADFDFTGSGDEIYGNLNAPRAILYSAVLYVLRCLISSDIPLNNGCLRPIKFKTREGSVVHPSIEAAVVGGNVETTQRIVDVMLKAFEAAAASQGTCNNFSFGINDKENKISFGYYETICGGSGAGPTWDGQSVVQCHTTNTRITDTELFEKRYPVIIHEFSIRHGSGGNGLHKGGNGVIRDIQFTYPNLEVSCLMERRAMAPFGLLGGESGLRGVNKWYRKSETSDGYRRIFLGGKCTVKVSKGDRILIMTPGGGGFGTSAQTDEKTVNFPVDSTKPSILTGSVGMRSRIQDTN
ncbi:DEHA2G04312p [Debaryomyces hansenii CBS767]|uniref:DEHA2G04312p n=1 Tax=Debaryomyces hansenii (strain ATCC 36239 / CBS 767 / BCRC 21394 / JCM 1990 / NBRC 0083 / IGC 2968) TaxID=284592 RepID=B5RV29_DEBHA|nr:DEHA2G04312p [Debaryomyces hansenii CBS767]CAR65908.1 DEHA2G04312p [Debaryomyces hansenii CBS767]|eukprot:XP_002770573.1 DEHA2G04312p [Debaryomyces hansenii CBS767]